VKEKPSRLLNSMRLDPRSLLGLFVVAAALGVTATALGAPAVATKTCSSTWSVKSPTWSCDTHANSKQLTVTVKGPIGFPLNTNLAYTVSVTNSSTETFSPVSVRVTAVGTVDSLVRYQTTVLTAYKPRTTEIWQVPSLKPGASYVLQLTEVVTQDQVSAVPLHAAQFLVEAWGQSGAGRLQVEFGAKWQG